MTAPAMHGRCGVHAHGGVQTPRRVISDHARYLDAYATGKLANKGETREAYLSLFSFADPIEVQTNLSTHRGFLTNFDGLHECRWLPLDIDRSDLTDALNDVRRLTSFLAERYDVEQAELPVYFSGAKGFHLYIELSHSPLPSPLFSATTAKFAAGLSNTSGVRLDAIYCIERIFRAPNTKHAKTGRFKIRLPWPMLSTCGVADILKLAEQPYPSDHWPVGKLNAEQLASDWNEAAVLAERESIARAPDCVGSIPLPPGGMAGRVQRFILDFIANAMQGELPEGDRERTLFRAAAALTEFPDIDSLIFAILTEPGEYSGLHSKEVAHAIRTGIAHTRRKKGIAQ